MLIKNKIKSCAAYLLSYLYLLQAQQDTNVEQTVVAGFLHAHLLGVGITLRHFRNGVEIEPMMDDPNYDFFFQEVRPIRNRTIKPVGIMIYLA